MTKSNELTNEELIKKYTLLIIKSVKQENFSGGTSIKTAKEIEKTLAEISKRFNLNLTTLLELDI